MTKVTITREVSPEVLDSSSILNSLSDRLEKEFAEKNYGSGVNTIFVTVNCINPTMLKDRKDFKTGLLIHKRFTKSRRILEFDIKLNFSEMINASQEEAVDIFTKGVLNTYSEIEALNIEDFDIGKFYTDLENILQNRTWIIDPDIKNSHGHKSRSDEAVPERERMSLDVFWNVIEKARIESSNNFDAQIDLVINALVEMGEKQILGFECTLRQIIMDACHFNVMALQKIVEGSVSDDSFLYFRCKLILYGRIAFENAINNPNYLFERIDKFINGELLLSAADKAFSLKFGDDTDKIFPRDYASGFINYDDCHSIQGKDWKESDLPKRYSKLWKMYRL